VRVDPRTSAAFGPLWFVQGAFGFAPRVVILRGSDPEETIFDRVVPFMTRRQGPSGISFDGSFNIGSDNLQFEGVIDLASLDEALRGHAMLHLTVSRDDQLLGQGTLLPGHFAEIDDGYRVGFAGLERWSEIVITRHNYGWAVMAGAIMALTGGMLWLVVSWSRR